MSAADNAQTENLSKPLRVIAEACGVDCAKFTGKEANNTEFSTTVINREVTGLCYDSRKVESGFVFFAIAGDHSDGHNFIHSAIERGAAAVFCEKFPPSCREQNSVSTANTPIIQVANSRIALSQASAAFYDHPENELIIIGVTGTDGKSSTVSFVHQLLEAHSIPSGYISTVAIHSTGQTEKNDLRQSTPEAPTIFRILREMISNGKKIAVIEATSHGLSDKTARLYSIRYDGAVFTNISQEHLEFHGNFENYLSDKANIFRRLRRKPPTIIENLNSPCAVINKGSSYFQYMKLVAEEQSAIICPFYIGGTLNNQQTGFFAENLYSSLAQTSFTMRVASESENGAIRLQEFLVTFPIAGKFNGENVLAAVSLLHTMFGIPLTSLAESVRNLRPVSGRTMSISEGQHFNVIIDYAHTPGSFKKLFPLLRSYCRGRLIVVFGSAGERDRQKRPIQGNIASEFADVIILSEEDPRNEDSMSILNEIEHGIQGINNSCIVYKIPDRSQAIKKAVQIAEDNDLIALLGKGHERNIFRAGETIPWNEEQVTRQAIQDRMHNKFGE